jgi:hypothetical protein
MQFEAICNALETGWKREPPVWAYRWRTPGEPLVAGQHPCQIEVPVEDCELRPGPGGQYLLHVPGGRLYRLPTGDELMIARDRAMGAEEVLALGIGYVVPQKEV